MKRFAELLDRLVYTPSRHGKLRLLASYFSAVPDPDRGYALAALTDGLPFSFPVRRLIMEMMERRIDPELFRLSRGYVGDTAETVALMWPEAASTVAPASLSLGDIVADLQLIDLARLADRLEAWLDELDASGRFALLKLLTGALRVGVSARLARAALAEMSGQSIDAIEEVWHGQKPPYRDLFDWLEGRAGQPVIVGMPVFRPMMLAHPLEPEDWPQIDPRDFAVEWKWDGIRVQVAAGQGRVLLFSRTGEDISGGFPDLVSQFHFSAILDGELLVVRAGMVQPFNDLQQRLNRKSVTSRMMEKHPAHIRLYDALEIGGEDLRSLSFADRRAQLEVWHRVHAPPGTDLSALIDVSQKLELEAIRDAARAAGIEGMMLKRRDSKYVPGRPKGQWYKWKRPLLTVDCVLMYAQRGSGKRSSYYSDFTFGTWTFPTVGSAAELVPVGKAYSGFTDEELKALDNFVRDNTIDRFGPVRSVKPALVLEVAFDAVQRSSRHKSGLALRFPRIARIRWDKPAAEADRLEALLALIDAPGTGPSPAES